MAQMNDWWGYLHTNGSIQVKRYLDDQDLTEARTSGFVKKVIGPFPAFNREDALDTAKDMLLPPPAFLS